MKISQLEETLETFGIVSLKGNAVVLLKKKRKSSSVCCLCLQAAKQKRFSQVSTSNKLCGFKLGSSLEHGKETSMPAQLAPSCVMDKRKADQGNLEKRPSKCSRSYEDLPNVSTTSLNLTDDDLNNTPFIDVFTNKTQYVPQVNDFNFADTSYHVLPEGARSNQDTSADVVRSRVPNSFQVKGENEAFANAHATSLAQGSEQWVVPSQAAQEAGAEQHIQFRNGSWKIMSAPEPSLPRFIHEASLNLPKSGIFSGIELVILLFYSYELFFEDTPYSIIKKILGTERGRTTLRRKLYKTLGKYDKKVNQSKFLSNFQSR